MVKLFLELVEKCIRVSTNDSKRKRNHSGAKAREQIGFVCFGGEKG
jgi:hypothetical protein